MKTTTEHMNTLVELAAQVYAYVVRTFIEIRLPAFMCEDKAWDIYTYVEGEGYGG